MIPNFILVWNGGYRGSRVVRTVIKEFCVSGGSSRSILKGRCELGKTNEARSGEAKGGGREKKLNRKGSYQETTNTGLRRSRPYEGRRAGRASQRKSDEGKVQLNGLFCLTLKE